MARQNTPNEELRAAEFALSRVAALLTEEQNGLVQLIVTASNAVNQAREELRNS